MTCTEESFLNDVREHKLTVIYADGVHRHIRLQKPGTMCMHFDLITWPDYLCYTGDMGTYVFRRLHDMFEFFRTDKKSSYLASKGLTLDINPGYWGEKLQAVDRCDGYKEWSAEKFKANLRECFHDWVKDRDMTTEQVTNAWEDVESNIICHLDDGGKEDAYRKAMDYKTPDNKTPFRDFYEWDSDVYSHRFMWCCYALAWGIQRYDESRGAT
jgi:hypothetical protein